MFRQTAKVETGGEKEGRRADRAYLPSQQRRKNPSIILGCISAVLLIAAAVVYLCIYREGYTADQTAQNLLIQYNQSLSQRSNASGTPSANTKISLAGYDIIGKLRIDSIALELPVLSQTTTQALGASICYYGGPEPGEKGNMIITGHNYANGALFGKLDKLKTGDTVIFIAPDGKAYTYAVYETKVVKPDEPEALNEYEGNYALTLATCANSGNRRLIVRCKLVSQGL